MSKRAKTEVERASREGEVDPNCKSCTKTADYWGKGGLLVQSIINPHACNKKCPCKCHPMWQQMLASHNP